MIFSLLLNKKQFIKYAISGTINTLITLIAYNLLIQINVNYMISNATGYILGIISGFALDKRWVFKSNKKNSILFIKFIIVNLTTLIFSSVILFILVNKLYFNNVVAQLIATVTTGIFNYMLNKLWTFS